MIEEMLRMREGQGRGIQDFLKKNSEWVLEHYDFEGRKMLVISKGTTTLPKRLSRAILSHQKSAVLYKGKSNIGRDDCTSVVRGFREAFNKGKPLAEFSREGFVCNTMTTGDDAGPVLEFYRPMGFKRHTMDLLENTQIKGSEMHAAVDLTAHYNMDIEKGTMDVFAVIANSREELLEAVFGITGATWEIDDWNTGEEK